MRVFNNLKRSFAAILLGLALTPLQAGAAIITVGPSDCSASAVNACSRRSRDSSAARRAPPAGGIAAWTARTRALLDDRTIPHTIAFVNSFSKEYRAAPHCGHDAGMSSVT